MSEDGAYNEIRKRQIASMVRHLHARGWPTPYAADSWEALRYHDGMRALAGLVLDDAVSYRQVLAVAPLAAVDVPRALYLLDLLDEGGPTVALLPSSFDDWPVSDHPLDVGFPAPYAWRQPA